MTDEPLRTNRIGLIGCGRLGRTVGARLIEGGFELDIHDLEREAATPLLKRGARWLEKAQSFAGSTIVSCLPRPEDCRQVLLAPGGVWDSLPHGSIHLELSTIGPGAIEAMAESARERRIQFVDAPVSRSAVRKQNVELVCWVGASVIAFDLARPVLEKIAERLVYCGRPGLGQVTKIVNNLIAHSMLHAVGEALALGVRAGASVDLLSTALQHGTGQNRLLDELLPGSLFEGDFRPGLRLDLADKDLELADELAGKFGAQLRSAGLTRELFEESLRRGWADQASPAAIRLIEERFGVELRSDFRLPDDA